MAGTDGIDPAIAVMDRWFAPVSGPADARVAITAAVDVRMAVVVPTAVADIITADPIQDH